MEHERKQVLFVGPHPLLREGLALLIERRLGFEAIQAGSFTEARQILGDHSGAFDLAIVVLDQLDWGGAIVIASIREAEPDLSVLALTAIPSADQHAITRVAGADEVLDLAVDAENIINAVERLACGQLN